MYNRARGTAFEPARNAMTYESMLAETVAFRGHKGDVGEAYYARPLGGGPWPGVVLIHHMPGWDEWIKEATRKLAHHGLATIAPHLYFREGPGSPDDVGARVRAAGGVADEQVLGDVAGCMEFLRAQPYANGKVGVIGFCSGGRHTYLAACSLDRIDAAVDCWGGNVIVDDPKQLNAKRPVAPIDLTPKLCSKSSARATSSTATTAPATPFSTPRGPPIARNRRSTAGTRCLRSSIGISPPRPRPARPDIRGDHHVLLHRGEGQAPGQRQGAERLDADRHRQRLLRSSLPCAARSCARHRLHQRSGRRARARRGGIERGVRARAGCEDSRRLGQRRSRARQDGSPRGGAGPGGMKSSARGTR